MLTWLRRRSRTGRTATELYGSIVAAARREAFYAEHGVLDTTEGRFALLVVHLYLVLERLREEAPSQQELRRALVEAFVTDMDDALREMGVGDLAVPRKVKKAAGALYDCTAAFRAAGTEEALAIALRSTVLPGSLGQAAPAIAAYMRRAETALRESPAEALPAGRARFPEP